MLNNTLIMKYLLIILSFLFWSLILFSCANLFKVKTLNGRYLICKKQSFMTIVFYDDSTYFYGWEMYYNYGSFRILKDKLFFISPKLCDTCSNIKIKSDIENTLIIKSGLNKKFESGFLDFIKNDTIIKILPFMDSLTNEVTTKLDFQFDYDFINIRFFDKYDYYKNVKLEKPKYKESYEVTLIPAYYFSIGEEAWKIKGNKIISPRHEVFEKANK